MAIQMILAFVREKFQGAQEAIFGFNGRSQGRIREVDIQQICFPADFLGRVGVGVGDQDIAIQAAQPPIHGGIGGQTGLQGINVADQILITLLQAIKAAFGAQDGKPGSPDMGRDDQGVGIGFQDHFEDMFGIQTEDGAAVGSHISQGPQASGELFGGFKGGQEHQGMHLPGQAVFFVDAADFAGDDETGSRKIVSDRGGRSGAGKL